MDNIKPQNRIALHLQIFSSIAPYFLVIAALLLFANAALAHERWILTPEQIVEWNSKPKPDLYTHWSLRNVTMISVFVIFVLGWVRLGFTGARELFPDLQARLASYGDHVPRILRFCVAWMLLSSAFGAEPRFGVEPFTSPTLFAPDLELGMLGPQWAWLRWVEVIIALAILFGVYVRFFAAMLILLALLGAWLFGSAILAYAGALIGVCIYLIMQGPGRHYIPLPTPPMFLGVQSWLASQPRQRAQAIMRVLTGATVLYLGICFKVLQPNLLLGIVKTYHLPVLSSAPEAFTLLMTLVEVTAGVLIIAGILLRPLSLVLLAAFLFFAALLPESYTSHILFYGVMLSFLFNAAGHWRVPEAQDKAAEIVIIGGGFSAISAATRVEKLIGPYTRVNVTLIHDSSNMLFYPLLPEVLSGGMQPGNVVNPIRRIIPQTRVVSGQLQYVNDQAKRVGVKCKDGKEIVFPYDELILALFLEPNLDFVPGMITHSHPINSVGDALHIRKRALELVESAELTTDVTERGRLLTFAVLCINRHHRLTGIAISPTTFALCSRWRGSHVPAFSPVGGSAVAQHRQSHADVRPRRRERFRAAALANNRRQAGVSGLRLHDLLRLSPRSLSALAMQGVRLRFFGDFGHAVRLA